MHMKATLALLLLALVLVEQSQGWRRRRRRGSRRRRRWFRARRIVKRVNRAYRGVSRFYGKHKWWIKPAAKYAWKLYDKLSEMRDQGDSVYDDFMNKLGNDLAVMFDKNTAADVVEGIGELTSFDSDELGELRSMEDETDVDPRAEQIRDVIESHLNALA